MSIDLIVRPDGAPSGTGAFFSDDDLGAISADFEGSDAAEIIGWAVGQFGPHLCVAASMTDAVLIDLAIRVDRAIEVVFIDTGYHFPETLETVDLVRRRYGLNLRIMTVAPHAEELWRVDPVACCSAVKVGQLDRALASKAAWMSGIRRQETAARRQVPIVGRDVRGLVKVSPLATWSDSDVADYIQRYDVPVNPLVERGYPSIGCQPCTAPVGSDADARAGRWAGVEKTECGLHL